MENKDEKNKEIKEEKLNNSENLEEIEVNREEEDLEETSSGKDNAEEKSAEAIFIEEIEKLRDEKLRLLAEMENLRKRSERARADSIRYGCFNLARDILSPDDNLSRALKIISKEEKKSSSVSNLIDGLKMVQKEFSIILEKYGISKIDALNKKFDHNYHQAMVEIESDEIEEGTVIQEMQCGYIMHDRLLRPSMVGVSKKPIQKKKDEEKE